MPSGQPATQLVLWRYGLPAAHVMQSVDPPPLHVVQSLSHVAQLPSASYWPSGHVEMHSPSKRMGTVSAWSHDVQLVDDAKHVWHVLLQLRHSPNPPAVSSIRYSPTAHVDVHVPATLSKVAPSTQAVQLVEPAPAHVRHELSQPTHVLFSFANLPLGHVAMHAPAS